MNKNKIKIKYPFANFQRPNVFYICDFPEGEERVHIHLKIVK